MDVFFTHKWTWAPEGTFGPTEYRFWCNLNTLGCFNKWHGAWLVRSQNRLERRRPACITLRLPQPMFIFYFRKFLTFWNKTFPAAAAPETNSKTEITVFCFGVIYINLMQIMYTKHKHTLLRINSVIKLKLNLYFILFYFIKNNQKSQISKFINTWLTVHSFLLLPSFTIQNG